MSRRPSGPVAVVSFHTKGESWGGTKRKKTKERQKRLAGRNGRRRRRRRLKARVNSHIHAHIHNKGTPHSPPPSPPLLTRSIQKTICGLKWTECCVRLKKNHFCFNSCASSRSRAERRRGGERWREGGGERGGGGGRREKALLLRPITLLRRPRGEDRKHINERYRECVCVCVCVCVCEGPYNIGANYTNQITRGELDGHSYFVNKTTLKCGIRDAQSDEPGRTLRARLGNPPCPTCWGDTRSMLLMPN